MKKVLIIICVVLGFVFALHLTAMAGVFAFARIKDSRAANSTQATPKRDDRGEYIVKKGDTLSRIAAQFSVTPETVARLNHLPDPNKLREGQALKLPKEG